VHHGRRRRRHVDHHIERSPAELHQFRHPDS
jgi:hypothetical protein